MRNTYSFTLTAKCPVDGSQDVYQVAVISNRMVPVESILVASRELTIHPDYQEALCQRLATELKSRVEMIGVHSGVVVKTKCGDVA